MTKRRRKLNRIQLADIDGWLEEFQTESDRACAVLAVAYIETQLEVLLRAFLVPDRKEVDELFDFTGPAGTLSFRRRLAFALGLLSERESREIDYLARIRNEFAHGLHDLSFETPPIHDLCDELSIPNLFPGSRLKTRGRERFTVSVGILHFLISSRIKKAEAAQREITADFNIFGKSVDLSDAKQHE